MAGGVSTVGAMPLAGRVPAASHRRTALVIAGLALVCALHLVIWGNVIAARGGPDRYARLIDFTATLTGARIVRDGDGAALYDLATQRAAQERVLAPAVTLRPGTILPYIHPPFEAVLVAPVLGLPFGVLYGAWSAASLLALVASLLLLRRVTPLAPPGGWLLLAAICAYSPIHQGLWLGQSSALVLLGLCGTYAALKAGHPGRAGLALSLLVLKPQMLLVVGGILLLQRRWRTLAACAGVVAALGFGVMPILGVAWPFRYARFLAGIGGWEGDHNEYPAIMHNWRGLAVNLFGPSSGLVAPLVAGLTLAALGLLALAWWRSRGAVAGGARPGWGETDELLWALAPVVAILVAPHLYLHDLTLLILPAWIVAAGLAGGVWGGRAARVWPALLWLGFALGLSSLFRVEHLPALPTVPSIIAMAAGAGLLCWRLILPARVAR